MLYFLIVSALAAAPVATETPAMRHPTAAPPNYPAACAPTLGAEAKQEQVTLAYAVTAEGRTMDVRVRESTNACFDGPAIDAARIWRFEPRRVNGVAVRQDEMETTLKFVVDDSIGVLDTDASPLLRVPPQYPQMCMSRAKNHEQVIVGFDVTPEGRTENLQIVESTNSCLNDAASKAVTKWRYKPKIVDGVAVPRRGVQTVTTFELSNEGSLSNLIRPQMLKSLVAVRSKLRRKNPNYNSILAELDAIEAKYGADFKPLEISNFYPLRGAARIEAKNYRGALDDLRIARSVTTGQGAGEVIQRTIEKFEAYFAAEDAAGEAPEQPSEKSE